MKELDKDFLKKMAPCSLLCHVCPGYSDGAISQCAVKMCKHFEGYYDFNDEHLPEEHRGWLPEFEQFHNRLKKYTEGGCSGCRGHNDEDFGCIEGCFIDACTKERGIHFCSECEDFPCEKAKQFFTENDKTLLTMWIEGSQRMREIGIKPYFEEKKDSSNYANYKKAK